MINKRIILSLIPLIGTAGTLLEAIFDKDLRVKDLEESLRMLAKEKPEVLRDILKGVKE